MSDRSHSTTTYPADPRPMQIVSQAFSEEQKQYLQGFMAGVLQRGGIPFAGARADGRITSQPEEAVRDLARTAAPEALFGTPLEDLSMHERIKLEKNPLAMWGEVAANAAAGRFPTGDDVFRYKALGLFYVAPAQDAFMLRCRIPGCMLTSHQLRGLAQIADDFGGGYADVTTRGNLQIRQIGARQALDVLSALYDVGLTSRGAGADNLRNITATPTSGFDPQELLDVRPLARAMHHYILNSPDLYGLPRKFNIAFDSGGTVSVAADTNDLGFMSVRVPDGKGVEPGVYLRIELGGITGHRAFAQDSGFMVRPDQAVAAAAAVIRVYLENGDRTDRKKARLNYLLERWGLARFMEEVQQRLDYPLVAVPREECEPRRPVVRHGHVGFHPQRDGRRQYVGVVTPVGRMTAEQMRRLSDVADNYGTGDVRLTVFQNVIIPNILPDAVPAVKEAIHGAGLHYEAANVRSGLVACTGNAGCQYANADTKAHARSLGEFLDARIHLDHPINIHFTGCPHSCAQHYCGDIGLLGTKVKADGEKVEGYHVVLGGGMDQDQGIARPLITGVPAVEIPHVIEEILTAYLRERRPSETFVQFTRRQSEDDLLAMCSAVASAEA